MLKVKLSQQGKKQQRTYRIVIAPARSKRDGKPVEVIGNWNPQTEKIVVDKKRLDYWLACGAQLTEGVKKLLENKKK